MQNLKMRRVIAQRTFNNLKVNSKPFKNHKRSSVYYDEVTLYENTDFY